MGRAIAVVSLIVACSFLFVGISLWSRRQPARPTASSDPAPMLVSRADGSLYAVSRQIRTFEDRLVEEERRWQQLNEELATMRREREETTRRLTELQDEIRRLRRQLAERPAPPPVANGPDSSVPPTDPTTPPVVPDNPP